MNMKRVILCIGIAVLVGSSSNSARANGLGSNPPIVGDNAIAATYDAMANKAFTKGDVAVARADYQSALASCLTDRDAMLGIARCSEAEGDFQGAAGEYRMLVNLNLHNSDIDLETEYVLALQRAGNVSEAISHYNRTLDMSKKGYGVIKMEIYPPDFHTDGADYDANEMVAMIHLMRALNTGYQDPARRSLEIKEALQFAPKSSLIYFYQGVLLQDIHQPGAKEALEHALALDHGTNAAVITKQLHLARN